MDILHSLPLKNIRIDDEFWNRYTNLVPDAVLPYQWEILNDRIPEAPASHCLQNFRIAAGEVSGNRQGAVFQDTDAYKWLEAVAYSLASRPNSELERRADEVIALIGRAQCSDGYINTYYTLTKPDSRWSNLTEGHELYCAGHMIEAAVAYYSTTGKREFLDIACKFADLICEVFGSDENKLHGCPGHPEIELALVRLYGVTDNAAYLNMAKYFIDVRGSVPNYFLEEMSRPGYKNIYDEFKDYDPSYSQSHLPVREQTTAEGHAVRAVYLYCAMADIAALKNDEVLLERCKILWENIVKKRMFITGGIGSSGLLERFTTDYDLSGDSCYCESCASIGLAQFGMRMAHITGDASYIETVERALYNTVRAGIALSGNRFFYVNPLEVWPDACMSHTSRQHIKPVRQKWFDVACCPTNIARTFTSLGQYIYSAGQNELFVNLFIQNRSEFIVGDKAVELEMQTDYPKTGAVKILVKADDADFSLSLRIPTFAQNPVLTVNGIDFPCEVKNGFVNIPRTWNSDEVALNFDIRPQIMYSNPLVRANAGKVAIVRGPEVYCFEETDNGQNLAAVYLDESTALTEEWDGDLLGGTMTIKCDGFRLSPWEETASFALGNPYKKEPIQLKAVPYGSWGNRDTGEMIVWVHL